MTASFDGTAQIWNGHTGSPLGEPMNHGDMVYDAVWSDDSSVVLTYGRSGSARLWDAASSRPARRAAVAPRPGRRSGLPARQARCRHLLARRHGQALDRRPSRSARSAEQAALETNVMTGMELGDDDIVRLLDVSTWRSRRDALEALRTWSRALSIRGGLRRGFGWRPVGGICCFSSRRVGPGADVRLKPDLQIGVRNCQAPHYFRFNANAGREPYFMA